MKTIYLTLAAVLGVLVLPGCLQSETTIHLNKDGSGTLVEETRLGRQMLAMIDQMSALGGPEGAKEDPLAKMFTPDKAKARAAELGEGVTFEKSEAITANGAKGARVTYHFKDINTLKISPGDSLKNLSPMGGAHGPAAAKDAPLSLAYADGKLTLLMPIPAPAEGPAAEAPSPPDMDNPDAQAMMKEMFSDMKMSIKLVVDSGIAATNATYQDGNTITLMDINMGKLLDKPEVMVLLSKADRHNPAAAMQTLKGVPGVKFETQKEVTVKIR